MASATVAFKTYDFDGDERFKTYLNGVEIASGDKQAALLKVKAKWYKKNVDDTLDVASVTSQSVPQSNSRRSETSGDSVPSSTRPSSTPVYRQPVAAATSHSRTASSAQGLLPKLIVLAHIAGLLLTLAYLQPLHRYISWRSYRLLISLTVVTQLAKIYAQHGLPKLSLASLKDWAPRVLPTSDFHFFLLAFLFMSAPPTMLLVLPLTINGAYYLTANYGVVTGGNAVAQRYAQQAAGWLDQRRGTAADLGAAAEVGIGFFLLMQLLTPARSLVLLFAYWQLLRQRYYSPEAGTNHRKVWTLIDQRTAPLLARLPILQRGVQTAKQFWQQAAPQYTPGYRQ